MLGFDEARESHERMYSDRDTYDSHHHKTNHDLIAGGAAFEAMKMFENHQRREVKHGFAKDLLAGIAGAEVDKLFQHKHLDDHEHDRDRTRHEAMRQAEYLYDTQYGGYEQYDP
ncbi:hypothetical protein GGS20DRAFT_581793 [Poronia punctata]|nr:hypothetical protein GGS20DRAFT_581793 [Poronia punctata]